MTHAWYSYKHDLAYEPAVFAQETPTGEKPIAVTFTHDDYERGWKYIREQMPQFDDYVYVGVVGRLLSEDPMDGEWARYERLYEMYPEEEPEPVEEEWLE